MIKKKNIDWYIEDPERLLKKAPFTRGGSLTDKSNNENVTITSNVKAKFSNLDLKEITQDNYLEEYYPALHRIKFNRSIPHIAVRVGDNVVTIDDLVEVAAYQKIIHSAHTLHLTALPMEFMLCNSKDENNYDDITKRFQELKQLWLLKNMESVKYEVVSKQRKLGDMGLLHSYDADTGKYSCKVYSYDEGYVIIPNYNEFGEKISCSLYYKTSDGEEIIDTYDKVNHYRFTKNQDDAGESEWVMDKEPHGFPICPLQYKRGNVAWEYAQSTIEMWELMANIFAIALKRFGTYGLVFTGEMDENSFKRDASTLIINLPSDTSRGKQDVKVLEFPEPQKMMEYLDYLEQKISIFSSVSFITPKDIAKTGSGGNGIFLAMKNDFALATQSVNEWSDFTNEMVYLFQAGLSLEEDNTNKYMGLKISAKLKPWSMESDATKITNLAMESKWLSRQSIIEKSPDAAPDEEERLMREEELNPSPDNNVDDVALKAEAISKNNNPSIQDETTKQTLSNN